MTWKEIILFFDSEFKEDDMDYILFNMTPYPLGNLRNTIYCLRRAIRILNSGNSYCEMCLFAEDYCGCIKEMPSSKLYCDYNGGVNEQK